MLTPSSIRNVLAVLAAGILVGLLTIATLRFFGVAGNFLVRLGNPHAVRALLAVLGGIVLYYSAYLLLVIQGFRTHWVWGVLQLLVPLSALLFLIKHPRRARAGMLLYLMAVLLFVSAAYMTRGNGGPF